MKVLIVDDEQSFLDLTKMFLEKEVDSLEVDTVQSAKRGLEKLENGNYQAVVSDYKMPEMDGLDFLENVREGIESDIPFIIFTGEGREEVAIEALNLGANRYLQKGGEPKSQYGMLSSAIIQEVNRHQAEEKSKRVLRKYGELFNSLNDSVFVHDLDGNFLEVNETAIDRLGYSRDELMSMGLEDIDSPVFSERAGERIEEIKEGKELVFESRHLTKDGEKIPVEISSNLITHQGSTAVLSVARDITDRKKAKERFKKLYETAPDPVFFIDNDGVIKETNNAFSQLLGYDEEEVVGESIEEAIFLTEEGQKEAMDKFKRRMSGEDVPVYTLEFEHRDGDILLMEINASLMHRERDLAGEIVIARNVTGREKTKDELRDSIKEYRKIIDSSIEPVILSSPESGKIIDVNKTASDLLSMEKEEIVGKHQWQLHPEDEEYSWKEFFEDQDWNRDDRDNGLKSFHIVSSDGDRIPVEVGMTVINLGGRKIVYSVYRDISRRKEIEKRSEYIQSFLRHDLQNEALAIRGFLSLFKEKDLPEDQEEYIDNATRSVQSILDLVEKMKALKGVDGIDEIQKMDLDNVLDSAVNIHEERAQTQGIKIEMDCAASDVEGGELLEEVFSNLVRNSIQHSDCDTIRIKTRKEGEKIIASVEDDGHGIPDDKKNEIFQKPWKATEKDSGLGLFLTKEIVKAYGGEIELEESELGGAKFSVRLNKAGG